MKLPLFTAVVTMSASPAVERAETDGASTAATATTAVARMSVIFRIGLSSFVLMNDRFCLSNVHLYAARAPAGSLFGHFVLAVDKSGVPFAVSRHVAKAAHRATMTNSAVAQAGEPLQRHQSALVASERRVFARWLVERVGAFVPPLRLRPRPRRPRSA